MARDLLDLLWRDHPAAPVSGSRGPRAKATTSALVDTAIALADAEGIAAVTVRRLAAEIGTSATAVYTHVGARDELLVLMVDAVRAASARGPDSLSIVDWRHRVRAVAEAQRTLHQAHPWILDVRDQRTAFGPGTIAAYDRDLRDFDGMGLSAIDRDAALTFVVDAARSAAMAARAEVGAVDMTASWHAWGNRLAEYVGDAWPLAREVGAAAGAHMGAATSATLAWRFALDRVLDALEQFVTEGEPTGPRAVMQVDS